MALDVAQLQVSPDRGTGTVPRFTINFGIRWRVLPESPLMTLIREVVVRPLIHGFLTPENRALGEALLAYSEDGDVRPMWSLVEERTGYPPDSLLKNRLRGNELKQPEGWTIWEFWELLNAYTPRLSQKANDKRPEGERREDKAAKFLTDSKSYGKLKRWLSEYETPKEQKEEALRAVFLAEKELQPGESLTLGKVEWPIERDNQPLKLKDKPDLNRLRNAVKVAEQALASTEPNTQEHQRAIQALREAKERLEQGRAPIGLSKDLFSGFEDPSTLAEFAAKHNKLVLDELLRQAPSLLSPQQLEVFRLAASGLRNKEIAERADLPASQVGVVLFDAINRLRRAVDY